MFCPACQSEFRSGFTRCASCEVDLVHDLGSAPRSAAYPPKASGRSVEAAPEMEAAELVTYCGFFSLEEAREARDQLRRNGIRSEICIREAPAADLQAPISEEFWLRVKAAEFRRASNILGYDPATQDAETSCPACGRAVGEAEAFCPHCGEPADERR